MSRLMKKAHLRRCLGCAALKRTTADASVVPTFAALHLDLFDQPALAGCGGVAPFEESDGS